MKKIDRRILVAIDGSIYSTNTVHYLTTLFADDARLHVDLATIVTAPYSAELQEAVTGREPSVAALSTEGMKKYRKASHCLDTAAGALVRAGFAAERVTKGISITADGIAQALLQRARTGSYDALVVGRRGMGRLEEMVMGSVSSYLLEHCHDIPIWLVDGRVDASTFLVPVDLSPHTMAAIDHLGFMLAGNKHGEITLFHSEALLKTGARPHPAGAFHQLLGEEWCARNLHLEDSHFSGAEKILISHGVDPAKIHRLHSERGIHPSREIIRQALKDDFGTIVMGRRGKPDDKGMLGGISDRVIYMAEQVALWIVG